jgi:hypothetical protein
MQRRNAHKGTKTPRELCLVVSIPTGVDRNAPVTLKLKNTSFSRALGLIVISASEKPARIQIEAGTIHVAPVAPAS